MKTIILILAAILSFTACKKERECYCNITQESRLPSGILVGQTSNYQINTYKGKKNQCNNYKTIDNYTDSTGNLYNVTTEAKCKLR